ncbi:MAG TPA: hypothetical protein VF760_04995 [Xanthobacteraceae bacterium]
MSSDGTDFDGCSRPCRISGVHTLVWGECADAPESARPEPRVTIGSTYIAADGHPSIGLESIPVSELAERIEKALRTVSINLGPNALAMLGRGEPVRLSGGEYAAMALAVAMDFVAPGGCCVCGCDQVVYQNYQGKPFCSGCADGDRP